MGPSNGCNGPAAPIWLYAGAGEEDEKLESQEGKGNVNRMLIVVKVG